MTRAREIPWWAELPLVAVSVATVIGFIRVYDSWSFLPALLAFALGAHVAAITTRRRRTPSWLVVIVAVGGAAVATGWILFPHTLWFGLPTGTTWNEAADALDVAREQYPVVVAPTAALPGFQLAAGLALWLAAWFADWTGHRLWTTAEAVAPTTAIFVFCAVLGSGGDQVACAALFAAAVLLFVAVQRSLSTSRVISLAALRTAGALALVALLLGVAIGPRLPGAGQRPAITWRGSRGDDPSRVTVSPMVELQKRLVQQSNQELFTVRSTQAAYWRLTALDAFDGQIWSSSGDFSRAGRNLPSDGPASRHGTAITQTVTIEALSAIWAPSAFEATSVRRSDTPLRWDPDSSTLIVDSSEPTSDGLTYTVASKEPDLTSRALERATRPDPPAITARYLALPVDFPMYASNLARTVTATATTRYTRALALQDWFRSTFDYSLDVPAGHSDQAIVEFLKSGSGYCEQFAGAFAAMARSLDIPARVAVGFTPGNTTKADPDLYRVSGRHAHAWPEVYFSGIGWVPFEPTPGRGIPGAQPYTGVRAQQNQARPVQITTTTTTAVPSTAGPNAETRPTRPPKQERTSATGTGDTQGAGPAHTGSPLAVIVGVLVGVAAIALAWYRRRRREAARFTSLSAADQAWERIGRALAKHQGPVQQPSETHAEFADRAAATLDEDSGSRLRRLADLVSTARWAPEGLGTAELEEVEDLTRQLEADGQLRSLSSSASSS